MGTPDVPWWHEHDKARKTARAVACRAPTFLFDEEILLKEVEDMVGVPGVSLAVTTSTITTVASSDSKTFVTSVPPWIISTGYGIMGAQTSQSSWHTAPGWRPVERPSAETLQNDVLAAWNAQIMQQQQEVLRPHGSSFRRRESAVGKKKRAHHVVTKPRASVALNEMFGLIGEESSLESHGSRDNGSTRDRRGRRGRQQKTSSSSDSSTMTAVLGNQSWGRQPASCQNSWQRY